MRHAAIVAALAAAALAAGCGETAKPLTRAQLIAKADPICRTVVEQEHYSKISPVLVVRFAGRLQALEQHAYEQLSKLTPPASMFDDWQLILDGFRDSARDFHTLAHAPHPQSEPGRFEQLYGDVRKKAWLAREDGFKECGRY